MKLLPEHGIEQAIAASYEIRTFSSRHGVGMCGQAAASYAARQIPADKLTLDARSFEGPDRLAELDCEVHSAAEDLNDEDFVRTLSERTAKALLVTDKRTYNATLLHTGRCRQRKHLSSKQQQSCLAGGKKIRPKATACSKLVT